MLLGGVFAFVSEDLGVTLPGKKGKSQKEKARKTTPKKKGDQGTAPDQNPILATDLATATADSEALDHAVCPTILFEIILGVDQPSHRQIGQVCELRSGARV